MSKFDVSSFSKTWDIQIFKLVIMLTLRSLMLIAIQLTLGQPNLILIIHFSDYEQLTVISLSLDKMLGCKKQSKPSLFDKKLRNHAEGLAQVIFNYSISHNQKLHSPVNK